MLQVTPQHRLLLAVEPVNFRAGIDGLKAVCQQHLMCDPFNGTIFAFANRAHTSVKLLVYDASGFWLCHPLQDQNCLETFPPAALPAIVGSMFPLTSWPSFRTPFPERFDSIKHAERFCQNFFPWYNDMHYHSGVLFLKPASVHYGQADDILKNRHHVLLEAFLRNPSRFNHKMPRLKKLKPVYINPPEFVLEKNNIEK